MPYRITPFVEGQFYHIYNRGSGRQPIFFEEENYRYLLRLFKKYTRTTGITVIAYCLMPNHYHFLVRQDGESPAGLLFQRVFNAYSKAVNKKYGRAGTLFQGRYRCILLDKTSHLFHLCRYIHANPVVAGLVATPEQWDFSNYREWISSRDGTLCDADFVRTNFGTASEYAEFVQDYIANRAELPPEITPYLLDD
ncbi:MAG: transposase [Chloroflexi bacterium]|jgi:REP element-mobilizing transposase RayT|nr:transposase [Chloroflexota bacterium]